MTDEQFWQQMRRAFLGMMASAENPAMRAAVGQAVAAIEKRYGRTQSNGEEARIETGAKAEAEAEQADLGKARITVLAAADFEHSFPC